MIFAENFASYEFKISYIFLGFSHFHHNFTTIVWNWVEAYQMLQITLSSQNYDITHFRQIVVKMSWLCDKTKKTYHYFITFLWQIDKKILWSSLALKDSYTTILFNKWSQSDKNVMKMWWLQISTYFLVHIIWKFPLLHNLMSDARCLDVDACLSAPIHRTWEGYFSSAL